MPITAFITGGKMKTAFIVLLMLFHLVPPCANAYFYQWTDAGGVVHLTDDLDKIPKPYQNKAKRLDVPDQAKPPKGGAPVPQAAPRASAPKPPTPGGHDESWWRGRMNALRSDLKALQSARSQKEDQLIKLQRERRIFQRSRDREAVNAMQAKVSADEARISALLNQIDLLESEAARAGVPAEWLR